jgi:hypothetical protein
VAERLAVSQEELGSMELGFTNYIFPFRTEGIRLKPSVLLHFFLFFLLFLIILLSSPYSFSSASPSSPS